MLGFRLSPKRCLLCLIAADDECLGWFSLKLSCGAVLNLVGWCCSSDVPSTKSVALLPFSLFLTHAGLEHISDIIEIVHQYIAILRKADDKTWAEQHKEVKVRK